ncbi:hypothetical protein J2W91_004652 [Paenibacillus amylolyticus]|uniref:SLH domain-containing protein n=1 Tax=Paenibacillus amylolyticus TaxID=1451 RepID=A0AAP5H6W0_PAEAM|nr:S-layer homology domain-containing protein [Paenibacillus amylolyticus]MDR6726146.1 hypothetical protein [Paenibacillus amylolyticus]
MISLKRMTVCVVLGAILLGSATAVAESKLQEQIDKDEVIWTWRGFPVIDMDDHWAKRLFQWGISQNIINGYSDHSFKPDQAITEAEFLKMLYRAMGKAIPNANVSANRIYRSSESWTEGPYRIAKQYNHPTAGENNFAMRMSAITKVRAAEIISASQGVHYNGQDAIIYLMGHGLSNGEANLPEQFDAAGTFSRAEALQWIRQLAIHGNLKIYERPKVPTDLSLLPNTNDIAVKVIPDFSIEPVTAEDFNLFILDDFPNLKFGDTKSSIDERFGKSTEKTIFNSNMYPLFTAHFNQHGELDGWKTESDDYDFHYRVNLLHTNKGIVLGKSTLSDILTRYGTAGVSKQGIIEYYYKKMEDGTFQNISIYDPIKDIENVYTINFIVDYKTQVVNYIFVTSLKATLDY